jgi:hypothetical protein
VDRFFSDFEQAYQTHIEAAGKEYHFLILISFLLSWGFIRGSAHMIRAQVSWWPGNVETKGGTHIHHLVWGILLLLVMGYLGISFDIGSPWIELVAIGFGIGMGLTLDEFALWLNLQDVYWTEKGRQSIDAVVVATGLLLVALLGLQFWIDVHEAVLVLLGVGGERLEGSETTLFLVPWQVFGLAFAIVCLLKGKLFMAIVGVFLPLVALVGAVRPAKPGSRWERRSLSFSRSRSGIEAAVGEGAGGQSSARESALEEP